MININELLKNNNISFDLSLSSQKIETFNLIYQELIETNKDCEITVDTLIKLLISIMSDSSDDNIKLINKKTWFYSFVDFLMKQGKTENTAYDYARRVRKILKENNFDLELNNCTIENIEKLIEMYLTGVKAEENDLRHNAPSSALQQYRDYLSFRINR